MMQQLLTKPYKGNLLILAKINILVYAGIAKPNPKMGQALGPLGINMMAFCKVIDIIRTSTPKRQR